MLRHSAHHRFQLGCLSIMLITCLLPVSARSAGVAPSTPAPITLEQAITLAVANNRLLKNAALTAKNAQTGVDLARIKGRPSVNVTAAGSQLLQPVDFRFPRGAFGVNPVIGAIPAADTTITSPTNFFVIANASVLQPITQLPRVRLSVQMQQAAARISAEDWRTQRNTLIDNVKQCYYGVAQLQSARDTAAEGIVFLTELERYVADNVRQGTTLEASLLTVQARLARQRQTLAALDHALQNTREQLNVALGRDVDTAFTITGIPPATMPAQSLAALQTRALGTRPDIRQAALKTQIARDEARVKRSEATPDVSLGVSYTRQLDISVVPVQVLTAGVIISWQDPVDWGRRRLELTQQENKIAQADNGLAETRTRMLAEVNAHYRALQDALAVLDADRVEIHAQQELRRVTMNRYQEKMSLLKDVLEADTALANANRQYLQDCLEAATAQAKLEEAIGGE